MGLPGVECWESSAMPDGALSADMLLEADMPPMEGRPRLRSSTGECAERGGLGGVRWNVNRSGSTARSLGLPSAAHARAHNF